VCAFHHLDGSQQSWITCPEPPHLHHHSRQLQLRAYDTRTPLATCPVCYFKTLCNTARGGDLLKMSDGSLISRRMKQMIPENGYATPIGQQSPSDGGVLAFGRAEKALEEAVHRRELDNADYGFTHVADGENGHTLAPKKVSIRDRIGCFTWTWYLMTMATGGIANVLHAIPYRSDWLNTIGTVVFLYNLLLFLLVTVILCMRFYMHPGSFTASVTHQSESLFIPASLVTIATIFINTCQYGIPNTGVWLQHTMAGLFWAYIAVAMLASSGIYLILWSTQTFPVHTMTPIWIFPAYPLLLAAPFGANLIDALPSVASASQINSLAITFGAITMQGTGFLVSMMIYGAFIYRLMTQKLPREQLRPGIFVSVGPSGFTVAGLVHLGNLMTTKTMPSGYMGDTAAASVLRLLADLAGLWLWGLCIWFFLVSVGAHWNVVWPRGSERKIHFAMTW
jgi:tellurite resistance protein TehA-like permease